jgi:hypothetical protein
VAVAPASTAGAAVVGCYCRQVAAGAAIASGVGAVAAEGPQGAQRAGEQGASHPCLRPPDAMPAAGATSFRCAAAFSLS